MNTATSRRLGRVAAIAAVGTVAVSTTVGAITPVDGGDAGGSTIRRPPTFVRVRDRWATRAGSPPPRHRPSPHSPTACSGPVSTSIPGGSSHVPHDARSHGHGRSGYIRRRGDGRGPVAARTAFAPSVLVDARPSGPVTIADVNADGNVDLVEAGAAVYLGNGDGSFQPERLYGPGGFDVVVGELTGDPFVDLAVTDLFNGGVFVLPGPLPEPRLPDFPESVPGAFSLPTGPAPGSLTIGDLDHSGTLDLVVGNSGDDTVSVLLGDGTGGFQTRGPYPAENAAILPYAALELADVDGGGDLDIVVADFESGTISVLRGNGDGTFQSAISLNGSDVVSQPVALAVGDLDDDTVPDLVVGGHSGGLAVFLGNGDGTFILQDQFLLPLDVRQRSAASVEIADLNLDGQPELVLGTDGKGGTVPPGRAVVLVRHGDGTWTRLVEYPGGHDSGAVWTAVGDLNADGRPDLATTNDGVRILLNQMGPHTSTGSTVVVVPFDPETGAAPVTITFNDVTQPGDTTAVLDEIGEQYFLHTTAQFAIAQVCFSYTPPSVPTIAHFVQPVGQAEAAWTTPPQRDTGSAVCVDEAHSLHQQWVVVDTSGPHTPAGSNISVNPLDPTTGTTPVTITFGNVRIAGETTVTSDDMGLPVPSGFRLGSVYYHIATSAQFEGAVEVCFRYSGPTPEIMHWVTGVPVIEPVTRDTGSEVCADVTSLSPFALVLPDSDGDTEAPAITCGGTDDRWHGANVSIDCTAHDDGSGLADPADAAFTLSTSVTEGAEEPDAATGTRQVCDLAGNCITAGPISGNKIDRKAPTLALPADRSIDATTPTGATATFAGVRLRRRRPRTRP